MYEAIWALGYAKKIVKCFKWKIKCSKDIYICIHSY